jgi:hypothetical protein
VHRLPEAGNNSHQSGLLECMVAWTWPLEACRGFRVVQQALEVADCSTRVAIAEKLKGHVREDACSPSAIHFPQLARHKFCASCNAKLIPRQEDRSYGGYY